MFTRKGRKNMRQKRTFKILTFASTHDAMAMEQFCRDHEIPGRLIPLPGQIAAGCGLCWRMTPEEYRICMQQLEDPMLSIEGFFDISMWSV